MKLYDNIEDFPIYNWFKCIELKDYSYCLVKRIECNTEQLNKCKEAFGAMYAQYLDTFGISDSLNNILSIQNQITILKIDKVLTGDKFLQTFIELKEIELQELLQTKQTKTVSDKVAIEKYLGFRINEKEISVKEYYEYINALKLDNGRATN